MVRRYVGAVSRCDVACTLVIGGDVAAGGRHRRWLHVCASGDVAGVVGGHVNVVMWWELSGMTLVR